MNESTKDVAVSGRREALDSPRPAQLAEHLAQRSPAWPLDVHEVVRARRDADQLEEVFGLLAQLSLLQEVRPRRGRRDLLLHPIGQNPGLLALQNFGDLGRRVREHSLAPVRGWPALSEHRSTGTEPPDSAPRSSAFYSPRYPTTIRKLNSKPSQKPHIRSAPAVIGITPGQLIVPVCRPGFPDIVRADDARPRAPVAGSRSMSRLQTRTG